MVDRFDTQLDTPSQPARTAFAITPHATNEIDPIPKAVYVGTGGDLVGRTIGSDTDVTFKNVPSGTVLDARLQYVRASGTTAADIVGLA